MREGSVVDRRCCKAENRGQQHYRDGSGPNPLGAGVEVALCCQQF